MLGPFRGMPSADEHTFETLRQSIDPSWIEEALAATGTATLRRRRLPAEQVLWLVLGMALYRHRPIDELVSRLDLMLPGSGRTSMAKSAVSQARSRLGAEPLKWLFERCAQKWAHESARRHEWRGLALYGVDGTTIRVPDSAENRTHFGGQTGRNDTVSAYPLARGVVLMALRSHLLAAARFGPYADERVYARELWGQVPDRSLVLVDRHFLASNILIPLASSGEQRHWLTRAKSTTAWTVVKKLGSGDELVELTTTSEARRNHPELPKTWQARAIQYQRPGFRPQKLLTSLVDPQVYPAAELRALYHERWELEIGFDEVKTDLLERQEAIRSKRPAGVMQELWAVGLVYNLVRLEMECIAETADVPPSRISFLASLRLIRDEWLWAAASSSPGAIPKNLRRLREELARFILPPRRSERLIPREVKIKMSSFPRKKPTKTTRRRPK